MSMDESDWRNDPCVSPPFCVLEQGDVATIVDQEGRQFMYDYRAKEFVRELADIMNENSERIVNAWRKSLI